MARSRRRIVVAARVAILAGLSTLLTSAAFGQPPLSPSPSRHLFEYWFGPTLLLPGGDGTIAATSAIALTNGTGSGRATQQLSLRTPRHLGVEGGFAIFPLERVGLQVRLDYASRNVSGTSGPYEVTLDYTSPSPVDGSPTPHRFTGSMAWPASAGSSAELTVGIDGAVRWWAGARLSGAISGGLTCSRLKGHVDGLASGQFTLIDDATITTSTYAISVSYGSATAVGIDAGGAIAVNVAGPLDVLVDARYFHAGRVTPAVRVTGLAHPGVANAPSLGDVRMTVTSIRASLDPSFARVFFGVRVRS